MGQFVIDISPTSLFAGHTWGTSGVFPATSRRQWPSFSRSRARERQAFARTEKRCATRRPDSRCTSRRPDRADGQGTHENHGEQQARINLSARLPSRSRDAAPPSLVPFDALRGRLDQLRGDVFGAAPNRIQTAARTQGTSRRLPGLPDLHPLQLASRFPAMARKVAASAADRPKFGRSGHPQRGSVRGVGSSGGSGPSLAEIGCERRMPPQACSSFLPLLLLLLFLQFYCCRCCCCGST